MYELYLLETPLCAHWEVSVRVCLSLYVCVNVSSQFSHGLDAAGWAQDG